MNSSSISARALIMRSFCAIFSSIRANASNADFSRHRRHRLGDALLRLGATLAREEQVLLALRFLDLVVQVAERALELLGLGLVRLPRELELLRVREVLAVPDERLLGEVVASFADGEHRPSAPSPATA